MAVKIGPSFGSELVAARGHGDGVAWNCDTGELVFTDLTPEDESAVRSVLAAHDPSSPAPKGQGR